MFSGEERQPRIFGMLGIQARERALGPVGRSVSRVGKDKIHALSTGAVGRERLAPPVEIVSPRVPHAAGQHIQLLRGGLELPDAALSESAHAPGRFDVAIYIDGLVQIKETVGAPQKTVDNMVGVVRAESRKHHTPAVGPPVAVRVAQVQDFRGIGHIDPAVAGKNAGGREQAVGEQDGAVRLPVAVRVFQDEYLVVGRLPRHGLRVGCAGRHEQSPPFVPRHLDGRVDHGIGGEEVDFESLRHMQRR